MVCFKECLDLKDIAPVDVVEKCVTMKCTCDIKIDSKEALELISSMDLADLNTNQGVGFFGFLWRFLFISGLGVAMFFGLRWLLEYLDEQTVVKKGHINYENEAELHDNLIREEYNWLV